MPPALQGKKKSELQEIANALGISDQGTKDELCTRLKKHLDSNQSDLEDDPQFSSLYGKRRRTSEKPPSTRFAPDVPQPKTSPSRSQFPKHRVTAFEPIMESTPAKDLRDISAFLKNPIDKSPIKLTPSKVPLPESPDRSIIDHLPRPQVIVDAFKQHEQNIMHNSREVLLSLRLILSSSRNIWSLTAIGELFYILSAVLATHSLQVPLSKHSSFSDFSLQYPQWSNFQSTAFWLILLHWALPTLILPTLCGLLISFHPITRTTESKSLITPLDYLTASIVRLAAHILYPYDTINSGPVFDVLGFRWRVLAASVGVAFAFAEAIALAPEVVAYHQSLLQKSSLDGLPTTTMVEEEDLE